MSKKTGSTSLVDERQNLLIRGQAEKSSSLSASDEYRSLFSSMFENSEDQQGPILELVSLGETLSLDAVDGTKTISNSKKVFSHIDNSFKKLGANAKGSVTNESTVEVYEMVKDATFDRIFASLSGCLDMLCLTQHQILNFIAKYSSWLYSDSFGTFFLFKSKYQFFVAFVSPNDFLPKDGSLHVRAFRFEDDEKFRADRRRIVVPQLAQVIIV